MKKIVCILISLLFLFSTAEAQQRVGLVLSGGGAKGMAHLGVIQALEENNIPIDYVTGTSIGAVVGGLYAIGYSPKEMLELFKSKEFVYWQTGEIQEQFVFSYKRKDPTPELFSIKFSVKDSLIIQPHYLPESLINPNQMNIAFLGLFAQATAKAGSNFDNLFVPFRCIASNVYEKHAVIMRDGDLGDAIRASMTFPFVFKPITINGDLLYDGGIYNNFPVDIMKEDFNPDYIIGVSVSSNPNKPDVRNIMSQMENMVMQHTNYKVDKKDGINIDFELSDVGLLDFNKADELFKLGYDSTIKKIEEIKESVNRSISQEELQTKRKDFKDSFPEFRIKHIKVNGLNDGAKKYIIKSFKHKHSKDKPIKEHFDILCSSDNRDFITFDEFRINYFKLLADERISEIHTTAIYDDETNYYDLLLDVTLDDRFLFSIGGNISSSVSSQAYFGLEYRRLDAVGWDFCLDWQFGQIYNGLQLAPQIDFPSSTFPFYLKLIGNVHSFNFYNEDRFFYEKHQAPYFVQKEQYLKFELGFPLTMESKMNIGIGGANLADEYYQSHINFTDRIADKNRYRLGNVYARYIINTLNDKQYPNKGMLINLTAQIAAGQEDYTSLAGKEASNDAWWQARLDFQRYCGLAKIFTLGIIADVVWSQRNFSQTYIASVLQAPYFDPTPHSKYTFNPAFSANQFIAGGIKPIFNITRQLSAQAELYVFLPIKPILANNDNMAFYGKPFSKCEYIGEVSVVWRLPFISASVFVNHYSSPAKNWNVGFNIGYLIFNKKFLE
jgi:NTE family protein